MEGLAAVAAPPRACCSCPAAPQVAMVGDPVRPVSIQLREAGATLQPVHTEQQPQQQHQQQERSGNVDTTVAAAAAVAMGSLCLTR